MYRFRHFLSIYVNIPSANFNFASDISKFHLEGFSLAIDNRGPAGDWSEGGQSTSGKVEMEV